MRCDTRHLERSQSLSVNREPQCLYEETKVRRNGARPSRVDTDRGLHC